MAALPLPRSISVIHVRACIRALVLALCCASLVACDSDDDSSWNTGGNNAIPYADVEFRIHVLVNEHRESMDLPPLQFSDCIAAIARPHSVNMAAGTVAFGHDGFSARGTEIAEQCTTHNASAENVARNSAGTDPAQAAVQSWLSSSGHRSNIEGNYTHTGIGVARSQSGQYYFTQMFIRAR